MKLIEDYKKLFFLFLENFHKYGQIYKEISKRFETFIWSKEFIIKLNESFLKYDLTKIHEINVFKNTNLNSIWKDIDNENKEKYTQDLLKVISLGKILKLNNEEINEENKCNDESSDESSNESFEIIPNENEFNTEDFIKKIESFLSKYISYDKSNINEKLEDIIKYVKEKYSEEINEILKIVETEKDYINNIVEEMSKINLKNLNLDINSMFNSKNKQKLLENLINKIMKDNPEITKLMESMMEKLNKYKDIMMKITNNNDPKKIKDFIYYVMNKFELKSHNFDIVNMMLKYIGLGGNTVSKDDKEKEKEKRRKKARCEYRKKLQNKNKKKRRRR